MVRRIAVIAAVVAVACGTLGVGVASAKGAPADAHGSANCSISGKIKIAPGLLFGGHSAGGSLFQAKVKGTCTGSSGVMSVKGNLTTRLPTNDCTALASTPFPASDFGPVKWKGTSKYTGSTLHFTTGSFTFTDPISLSLPGSGTSSVASGSFSGQHPTMTLVINEKAADLATACGKKGLKKMSFAGASNITIPA
jgi:hypothetical protein